MKEYDRYKVGNTVIRTHGNNKNKGPGHIGVVQNIEFKTDVGKWWVTLEDGHDGFASSFELYTSNTTAKQVSDGSSTSYYKIPEGCTDLIDLIELKNMNFAIGNIFKACFRLGEKAGNDNMYDLNKIRFFVDREIERVKKLA